MQDATLDPTPDGVKLFVFEHGALWPLAVKSHLGEGGTLGYENRTHGPLPKYSEVELRWDEPAEYRHADRYAAEMEKRGWRVLVIKGLPADSEVGRG